MQGWSGGGGVGGYWNGGWGWGSQTIFPSLFKFDRNFILPSYREVITMKFCIWHDSCAVVTCAKFYSDMALYNRFSLRLIFHQIWNTMEKSFAKWEPGSSIIWYSVVSCTAITYQTLTSQITPHISPLLVSYGITSDITWASWCLKSQAFQLFVQQLLKKTIIDTHY